MAVSTLQQRQQEIHRPFQPFADTEGRVGRNIAEPQEQYAGGWNIAADVTKNLGQQYHTIKTSNRGDEKINPIAASAWAQASFDFNEHINNLTPEEKHYWDTEAQRTGQTTHEYLKQQYAQRTVDFLYSKDISPWEVMYAKEKAFKADVTGAKDYEQIVKKDQDTLLEFAKNNNMYITDEYGNLDRQATLQNTKRTVDAAFTLAITQQDQAWAEVITPNLNITFGDYQNATSEQKKVIETDIANLYWRKSYSPLIEQNLDALQVALNAGNIKSFRELALDINGKIQQAYAEVDIIQMPTESKKLLKGMLNDYRTNIINKMEQVPDQSVKDLENIVTVDRLVSQISASQDKGTVGLLYSARQTLGDAGVQKIIEVMGAEATKAFKVGGDIRQYLTNLSTKPEAQKNLVYIMDGVAKLYTGQEPTYGDIDTKQKAKAIAWDNYQEYLKTRDLSTYRVPGQHIMNNENAADILKNRADTALMLVNNINSGSLQGEEGSTIKNFMEVLEDEKSLNFLQYEVPKDIKDKYIQAAPGITDARLTYPDLGGVLSKIQPNENRWISFDTTNKKFIVGQASEFLGVGPGFSSGTSNKTMLNIAEEMTQVLNCKLNAAVLYLGAPVDDATVEEYVKNMYNTLISVSKVTPEMFKENNYGLTQTKP